MTNAANIPNDAFPLFGLIFGSIVIVAGFSLTIWSLIKEKIVGGWKRWEKIVIVGGWIGLFVLITVFLTRFQLKEIEVTIPAHRDTRIGMLGKLPVQEEIFVPERRVKRYVFIRKHHKEETIENNEGKNLKGGKNEKNSGNDLEDFFK